MSTIPLIAYKVLSPYTALVISELSDHHALTYFALNNEYKDKRTTAIHYTKTGRPYIIRYQQWHYLDEFIRFT